MEAEYVLIKIILSAAVLSAVVSWIFTKLLNFIPDSLVYNHIYLPETKREKLDGLAWVLREYTTYAGEPYIIGEAFGVTAIDNPDSEVLNQLLEEGYWEEFKKKPNIRTGVKTVSRYTKLLNEPCLPAGSRSERSK